MTWGDVGLGVAGVSVAADEVIDAELSCLVADPMEDDPVEGEWGGSGGGHRWPGRYCGPHRIYSCGRYVSRLGAVVGAQC
jgi:hypothetical protein